MKHIISIIICLVILLGAAFVHIVSTEDIVNGYGSVVEILGKSQLTSNISMIGDRYERKDDYTGRYSCNAESVTGKDITYGGCSIRHRKVKLQGKVSTRSGKASILFIDGSESAEIQVDKNGDFCKELDLGSGSNYIAVEYDDFTGEIDFKSEYMK